MLPFYTTGVSKRYVRTLRLLTKITHGWIGRFSLYNSKWRPFYLRLVPPSCGGLSQCRRGSCGSPSHGRGHTWFATAPLCHYGSRSSIGQGVYVVISSAWLVVSRCDAGQEWENGSRHDWFHVFGRRHVRVAGHTASRSDCIGDSVSEYGEEKVSK